MFLNAIREPREPSNVLKRFNATLRAAGCPSSGSTTFDITRRRSCSRRACLCVWSWTFSATRQMATTADLNSHVMPAAHKDVADLLDRAMLAQS